MTELILNAWAIDNTPEEVEVPTYTTPAPSENALADAVINSTNNTAAAGTFVNVSEDIATTECGMQVLWNMRGNVDIETMTTAWETAGLETTYGLTLPNPTTPKGALKRAMDALASRRVLVRPLAGRGSGFALVNERADTHLVDHEQQMRAMIDNQGKLVIAPWDHELAAPLKAAYDAALTSWSTKTLSYWFGSDLIKRQLCGVALRERGGTFYIPPMYVTAIKLVKECLEATSDHSVYLIPMIQAGDAVKLVLDSVVREAKAFTDETSETLANDPGKRALSTQTRKCDEMLDKLRTYAKMAGSTVDVLRASIEDLRGDAVAQMLTKQKS